MAAKIRTLPNFYLPGAMENKELRKNFKSLLIWDHKPVSEAVTTSRKRKPDAHSKTDDRRIIEDNPDHKVADWRLQEILEVDKIKPLSNPSDPYDDFNVFWNPRELLDATTALATYNVKELYKKNPYTAKNVMHLILLILKYKPFLKDLLEVGEYFERFPEDEKDENIVFIALFDILCRGNGITLENEMDASLRIDYKNIGLKVVYMQVEKDKVHYFEQVHDRLNDIGASSVHDLLHTKAAMQINVEFPMIFDIWINRSKFDVWPEQLLEEAGFKRVGTRTSSGLTYNEIVDLPYLFELGVSNYSEFIKTSHYCNHVFIPTDRNHCLAMVQMIRQLYKGGITKGTVIQTHILSLSATAYFGYLLNIAFPTTMKLKVFGADRMKESFESYFELLNLKNVQVFSERFYIVNCRKKGIASTTCVLVNPETVFNPSLNLIKETINRGYDIVYLQSAYELFSENDTYDYSFINQHTHDLKQMAKCNIQRALSIPKVKFIIYQSFNTTETADENIALNVVKFARECSYTSVVSVKENMTPTEIEDANYKYCRKLDLYFMQGNTPNSIVSPALWGSKPPFISTIYRVDPVIYHTETEREENEKYSTHEKLSSRSNKIKFPSHTREKHLKKFPSRAKSMTSVSRRATSKNSVGTSGFSTDSDMNKKIISSKVNIKFLKPRSSGKYESENGKLSNRSDLQKGDRKISKATPRRGFERIDQSSIISSGSRNSTTLMQVRESPPDFKKMILSEVMLKNEPMPIPSKKEEPVLKKILKNKRSKKIVGDKKEVLFSDQVENIDSQQVSESDKSSLIQNKASVSDSFSKANESNVIKNETLSRKESILTEDFLMRGEVESIDSQETKESTKLSQIKGKRPSTTKYVTKIKINEKHEQNKKLSKEESILVEDISLRDELDSIDSQEISEIMKISQIKDKRPTSSHPVKKSEIKVRNEQNKKFKKKETIRVEDIPSQIKNKSDKELKKGSSGSKSFPQTSLKKDINRNQSPRTSKKMDSVKDEQTLLRVQHSPLKNDEIIDQKGKDRNLPKKSRKINQNKMLPTNYLKVKKEAPIISFGTIFKPKSNPIKISEKNLPSKKRNTATKKKADVKEISSASRQQKSVKNSLNIKQKNYDVERVSVTSPRISTKEDVSAKSDDVQSSKFYVNSRKRLSDMQKRFKKEILHNFQTHFFHSAKHSDVEEKSSTGRNRPSSSVSWKTYTKTARKLSELYLIKLLKKENFIKEKEKRKNPSSRRTKCSISPISTKSELEEITDDEESKFSRRRETVLWSEYKPAYFDKLMEIDEKALKPSIASSLYEMDKNEINSITSSLLEINQKQLKPSIVSSQSAQSLNKDKMISKRKKTSKNKMKLKKKIKNKRYKNRQKNESRISIDESGEENNQQFRSENSLIKIVLENSEGTQTKAPRKTQVYNVGTQADQLQIYLSLNNAENKQNLQRITEIVGSPNITYSSHGVEDLVDEQESLRNIASNEVTIITKGELKPKQDNVTVSKMISWFQQLKSEAPIPPRAVSYVLRRRKCSRKSTLQNLTEDSKTVVVEDSEDLIEEGVDDIPSLAQDYKIEDAQTILAQMKMYDAGERNLNKLISTDLTNYVDFDLMDLKVMDENELKEKSSLEVREEIVALNKNLLKYKAEELSLKSFPNDDGFEEEEPFNMDTKGKDMNSLLTRLIDNIFETDTKTKRASIDEVSVNTREQVVNEKSINLDPPNIIDDSENQLQSSSLEEVWKNTTREAWNKRNVEMVEELEEKKKEEEVEENSRQPDRESEPIAANIVDIVPKRTPTDGLSPLARELYEIRDIIEFYLHSKVEPLDWRVMIDRREDD